MSYRRMISAIALAGLCATIADAQAWDDSKYPDLKGQWVRAEGARGVGRFDPTKLPDAVVCYTDTTIAMPLLTHYALAKRKPRKLKRLYDQRPQMMKALTKEYFLHNRVRMIDGSEPILD